MRSQGPRLFSLPGLPEKLPEPAVAPPDIAGSVFSWSSFLDIFPSLAPRVLWVIRMSELASAELCAAGKGYARTPQVWTTLLSWFSLVVGILWQMVKGTPSLAQVLSYVGVRHPLLSPSPAFKPLPVDASTDTTPQATESENAVLKRLTVVLDLDETLVCAYETSSLPPVVHKQATEAGLRCFELECISGEKDVEGNQKVNHVTVFERPGLQEFLQQISEFSDLVLFTAGLEGYAKPLVDQIDVDNRFSHRLYRPATISTKLEAQLDEQLNSYRRLVLAKPDGSETDLESGIERLLKQLQQVNSQMQTWVSSGGSEILSHTLNRHREISQDLTQEFYRLRSSQKARQEHASLLDFRDFDKATLDVEEGGGNEDSALLKEQVALNRSAGQMDSVISQAQATLGSLVLQRSAFSGINAKLSNVSSRLPTVNHILAAIRRRKSMDTIILSLVAALCTFLILIYWLSK